MNKETMLYIFDCLAIVLLNFAAWIYASSFVALALWRGDGHR